MTAFGATKPMADAIESRHPVDLRFRAATS
jgi:hypothetical protein